MRRVKFRDVKTGTSFNCLTNHCKVSAVATADLSGSRWQVELLFVWVQLHVRIPVFLALSQNDVKSRIGVATSVYVLVASARKRLAIPRA